MVAVTEQALLSRANLNCSHFLPTQELHEGPWSQRDLDGGANVIIPIPPPLGGAVVVGENVVAYFNEGGPPKVTPIQPTIIQVSTLKFRQPHAELQLLCVSSDMLWHAKPQRL